MQQRAALLDALVVDQRGDVIPHRRRKLRLLVHEAHGVVGLEIAQRAGNGLLGYAGSGGGMAKAGEARAPIRPRGRAEEAKGGEGRGKKASVFHGGDYSPKGLTRANYRGRPFPLPPAGDVGPAQPGRVRALGKFQPGRNIPHPTPLRGATFSHEWEKDFALVLAPVGPEKYRGAGTTGASLGCSSHRGARRVLESLRRLNHEQRA